MSAPAKPPLTSVLFRLPPGTLAQISACAALPECGNNTAVIRQAVAEFAERKLGAAPAKTSKRRKKSSEK